MAKTRRRFSDEFKEEVVKLVINGGRRASEVAQSHQLLGSQVSAWVRQARIDAGDNPRQALTSSEREELTRLRRRDREREAENSFLKKTLVYLAAMKK